MDFRLTDEQEMLAATLRGFLASHCTGADLRRLAESGSARDDERWRGLVDMGLPGVMATAEQGGVGLGPVEMALVAMACGYASLPEPLVDIAGVAVPLLQEVAPDRLNEVLAGATVAVAHPANPFVTDAEEARAVLAWRGPALYLVERSHFTVVPQESFDPLRRLGRIEWTPGDAREVASGERASRLKHVTLERGALFAAAALIGLGQHAIDLGVAYAAERHQFGKPIGSFQAVKHLLANAQVKIEFARPVVLAAAAELAADTSLSTARISHAKVAAAAAADAAAHAALQVHGAMGYSWEVDVHFLLKRTLALAYAWGTPTFHRDRVAAHVLAAPLGPDGTFGAVAAREAIVEPA
jgi:alkylation response protein AidB-like acyl-CoA dehydrogenase